GIDEDADGDGDAPQGHDIGGDAHHLHGDEGDQDGDRQGQHNYQGALEVEQEDKDDERYDYGFFGERLLEGVDGALDQVGAVVGDHDPDAGGQAFLQFP